MRQLLLAAGLLGLIACTQPRVGGEDMKHSPSPTPPVAPAAAVTPATPAAAAGAGTGATGWRSANACELLDKSVVAKALGVAVSAQQLTASTPATASTPGASTCTFLLEGGKQLTFAARRLPTGSDPADALLSARGEMTEVVGAVEDVTGVGLGAFWIPKTRQLIVYLADGRYFSLAMPRDLGAKDPKAIALGLTTRIA